MPHAMPTPEIVVTEHLSRIAAVEAAERRRVAAMAAADIETLDALLHPDMLFGHTNGHADDKATYLAKFRSGAVRYLDVAQTIEACRVIDDIGLVTFHLKMRAELATGSRQLNVIGLTVWSESDGGWRLVAHHPTVVDFD